MPLYRRPNPTDPGDAADLSTPQGIAWTGGVGWGNRGNRPGRANPIGTPPESNGIEPLRRGNLPSA